MADRKRMWMPWRLGTPVTLTSGSVLRIAITSIADARLGRQVEGYTAQRAIFEYSLRALTTTPVEIILAIINLPTGSGISATLPGANPMMDWQWWEATLCPATTDRPTVRFMHRDIATVRKSPGRDRQYWFYMENVGTQSVEVWASGRSLVLE